MSGVIESLWQEVSRDRGFASLELHSNNPRRSQAWLADAWSVVVDPGLDRRSPTDLARARLDAQALVEVHNEVVRRLDPNRFWQAEWRRVEGLHDLPDLVIGYLAAEHWLAPSTGEHQERIILLEGILYARTRELVREQDEFLDAQVPVIAALVGVGAEDERLGVDLLRRFR